MRIVHLTDDQLRGFLGGPQVKSGRTLEHLKLCDKCQVRLAEAADRSSLIGDMASSPLDRTLADRVICRLERKAHRRRAIYGTLYLLGALATVAAVVVVAGADLYSGVVLPVWGMMVAGVSGLGRMLQVAVVSLKSLSTGQTLLALAAVAALLWVGLLDKLVTRIAPHRSRA